MDEHTMIPYVVYESANSRFERTIQRLIGALILCIVLLFASNALWLYEWTRYDYTTTDESISVDAGSGTANYIGEGGDINNGTDNGKEKDSNTTQK